MHPLDRGPVGAGLHSVGVVGQLDANLDHVAECPVAHRVQHQRGAGRYLHVGLQVAVDEL